MPSELIAGKACGAGKVGMSRWIHIPMPSCAMLALALLAWAGGVELEDLRVGEVNDLVEDLTAGGAEVP